MEVLGIEHTNFTYICRLIFCTFLWNRIPFKYVIAHVLDNGDYISNCMCVDYRSG